MTTPPRRAAAKSKPVKKAASKAAVAKSKSAAAKKALKAATNAAIATELAPAVAIALLDKTEQSPGDPTPALDCLAAGATASETEGKLRVQLMFESGAVLPVEMSTEAGEALVRGLTAELKK